MPGEGATRRYGSALTSPTNWPAGNATNLIHARPATGPERLRWGPPPSRRRRPHWPSSSRCSAAWQRRTGSGTQAVQATRVAENQQLRRHSRNGESADRRGADDLPTRVVANPARAAAWSWEWGRLHESGFPELLTVTVTSDAIGVFWASFALGISFPMTLRSWPPGAMAPSASIIRERPDRSQLRAPTTQRVLRPSRPTQSRL